MIFQDLMSGLYKCQQESITFKNVTSTHGLSPLRICFNSCHKNALRKLEKDPKYFSKFTIPFEDSILPIYSKFSDLTLFKSNYGGYWRSNENEEEHNEIEKFINAHKEIVFLRDTLACSIALSEHRKHNIEEFERTNIAELLFQAKFRNDSKAVEQLAKILIERLSTIPIYKSVNMICAMPPSNPDEHNVPNDILEIVCKELKLENISKSISWKNKKNALKELPFEKRWEALSQAELIIDKDISKKNIILFDDLYQSGTTMQFVGMKLLEKKAKRILGLTLVKSSGNSDNV